MTARALAEQFEVSERTIWRDLVRLQDLDIELDIQPGRNGGVKLVKGAYSTQNDQSIQAKLSRQFGENDHPSERSDAS